MVLLWEMGLANALAVAALAPLAALAARASRRPAWAHALWLIVLLKLVTPPLLRVPIGPAEVAGREAVGSPTIDPAPSPERGEVSRKVRPEATPVARPVEPEALPPRRGPAPAISWPAVLGSLWIGGSAAWLALASWRIVRFARVLRRADPAPGEMAAWVGALSDRLGLRRPPLVVLTRGRVSPMVWTLGGRARLVVPEALWHRLGDDQRAAMLVHELAHLKRGDPWVRLLEVVATGLYWWHPALWWSRRELHRAEEACCDLWVVWALPEARKRYASALVEAVDFLSEARPMALPTGASGMGQVEDLSRRIRMIMKGDTPRGLTRAGALATIGLAAVLLPWRPSRAQQEPGKPEDNKPAAPAATEPGKVKTAPEMVPPTPEQAEARIAEEFFALPQVAQITDRVDALETRLKVAKRRIKAPEGDPATKQLEADLADVKARYQDFWARMYPRIKQRIQEGHEGDPDAAGASARLRAELKAAIDRLAWSEKMREKQFVPAAQVAADKANLERAKEEIVAERKAREGAIRQEQEEVELARSRLQIREAGIAKAEAQRKLAQVELARIERLSKRGAGFVSSEEKEKAQAELEIAEAQVQEATAQAIEDSVKLRRAEHRAEATRRSQEAAQEAKAASRDADRRLDDLESKLDRVLKVLEAIRKEKAETPAGGPGQ